EGSLGLCPNQNAMVGQCTNFLFCADGQQHLMACPEGLAFNDQAGACDWGDRVPHCQLEHVLGFTCPTPADEAQLSLFGDHARYPSSRPDKYFVCVPTNALGQPNTSPRLLSCAADTAFNPST